MTFYDSDEGLAEDVARFLADGFDSGDAAVILATSSHRRSIEASLRDRAFPIDWLRDQGRYVWVDAGRTLATLMVDGAPDRERFAEVVGGLVASVAGEGRRVRAFGEMVGLLWEAGDVASAVVLESFWNELCRHRDLTLFCAYPAQSLVDAELRLVDGVCAQHSEVLPPACYTGGPVEQDAPGGARLRSRLFLPVPVAARAVRRFVAETLDAWGALGLVDDAALVASELSTNALRHTSSPFRVSLRRTDVAFAIFVHDVSVNAPQARVAGADAVGGRGLAIVGRLSSGWGSEPRPDGKVVWATLPMPG